MVLLWQLWILFRLKILLFSLFIASPPPPFLPPQSFERGGKEKERNQEKQRGGVKIRRVKLITIPHIRTGNALDLTGGK